MEVNLNDPNVSSTLEENEKREWSVENLYKTEYTLDSLVETLQVLDIFKRKYPNDQTIKDFEEIVREEICQMFGGTTIDID